MSAARERLSQPRRPDAIFCATDYLAIVTLEVARFEFGIAVGRELGIAGFEDIDQASMPTAIPTCRLKAN